MEFFPVPVWILAASLTGCTVHFFEKRAKGATTFKKCVYSPFSQARKVQKVQKSVNALFPLPSRKAQKAEKASFINTACLVSLLASSWWRRAHLFHFRYTLTWTIAKILENALPRPAGEVIHSAPQGSPRVRTKICTKWAQKPAKKRG